MTILLSAVLLAATLALPASAGDDPFDTGSTWHAWLDSPGGALSFGLELARDESGAPRAVIVNGDERIEVPRVEHDGDRIRLHFDHYDAVVRAKIAYGGKRLDGAWEKVTGRDTVSSLEFHALPFRPGGDEVDPTQPRVRLASRWSVTFSSSLDPAVGLFEVAEDGTASGTFLTITGDYRFLSGSFADRKLRLACFDGAHAFLFVATLGDDGVLRGDFWSRDTWHETWTAVADPEARLPDAFGRTLATDAAVDGLVFRDLDGEAARLGDLRRRGGPMVVEVFGSWCPNCHDAAALMTELHERHADDGLVVVGLAFELTGDFERDARQVRRFAERHGAEYPMLVAGIADKAKASAQLPILDRIRAYPTTIFIDGEGRLRKIHTGFAGPATGEAHERLRAEFERIVEEMLAAAATPR